MLSDGELAGLVLDDRRERGAPSMMSKISQPWVMFAIVYCRVINRRDSRLDHIRCYVLWHIKSEEKKERFERPEPWHHQQAGLTGSFHISLGIIPAGRRNG
jgi:hypothetical protein